MDEGQSNMATVKRLKRLRIVSGRRGLLVEEGMERIPTEEEITNIILVTISDTFSRASRQTLPSSLPAGTQSESPRETRQTKQARPRQKPEDIYCKLYFSVRILSIMFWDTSNTQRELSVAHLDTCGFLKSFF